MDKFTDYTDPIDIDEQIARIDKLLVETHTKQRENHMQLWQVAATVFAGGVAFFADGAAFVKLVGR